MPTSSTWRADVVASDVSRPDFSRDEIEHPTLEVRAYRHGKLVATELCESEDAAADLLQEWEEQPGVVCEIDDLSVAHAAGEILEPGTADVVDDPYPRLDG